MCEKIGLIRDFQYITATFVSCVSPEIFVTENFSTETKTFWRERQLLNLENLLHFCKNLTVQQKLEAVSWVQFSQKPQSLRKTLSFNENNFTQIILINEHYYPKNLQDPSQQLFMSFSYVPSLIFW